MLHRSARSILTAILIGVVGFATSSCERRPAVTILVGVGSRGGAPTMMSLGGSCASEALPEHGPGQVTRDCPAAIVHYDFRRVAKLVIKMSPRVRVGDRLAVGATALDENGTELVLGEETPLHWTFSGVLARRPRPGPGDIIPIRLPANDDFAIVTGAGPGAIDLDAPTVAMSAHASVQAE